MMQHLRLNVLLTVVCISSLSVVFSHPHDNPLKFEKQVADDGRVIYSNIEKRCFSNGHLICTEYHPIWNKSQSSNSLPTAEIPKPKLMAISNDLDFNINSTVKKSITGKCHVEVVEITKKTKKYESFVSMKACIDSGGIESEV